MDKSSLSKEASIDKVGNLRRRIMVINMLTLAKRRYKYRELSEIIGIPPSVLSRYIRGRMLPSDERVEEMLDSLTNRIGIEELATERIHRTDSGYYDVTGLIWDVAFLRLAAAKVSEYFSKYAVTKVLTASADGVPIASLVGDELGADLVVAKETREVGLEDFIDDSYSLPEAPILRTFYIPRRSLRRNDRVLVVDDVIRTGGTVASLIRLARRAGTKVVGLFTIISVGDRWRTVIEKEAIPHCSLLHLP